MRRIAPYLLLVLLVPKIGAAQSAGQISGSVSTEGGRPLPSVTVSLDGTRM